MTDDKGFAAVLLCNPKSPYNVGGVLRACHIFGVSDLCWSGERVKDSQDLARFTGTYAKSKWRLPREERMKEYQSVAWSRLAESPPPLSILPNIAKGVVPVAVEVKESAESLTTFDHPENALYVFGPEDGSIPKAIQAECHRFVTIPSSNRTPLNLAVAVNIVLYDRFTKGSE